MRQICMRPVRSDHRLKLFSNRAGLRLVANRWERPAATIEKSMKRLILALPVLTAAMMLISQPVPPVRVGPLPGGGFLLNSGWTLRPAGRQLELDTFPMASLATPDGKYLLVLNGGYNPPSIATIDVKTEQEVARVAAPDAWLGMVLASNGRLLYVGGGSRAAVLEYKVGSEGKLEAGRTFEATEPGKERTHRDFVGDVTLSPDGRLLYAADLFHDRILVINPQSGRVIERFPTGRRPYRILFHPDGKSYFVTSWTNGMLYQHEAENGRPINSVRLGPHTTDMIWRDKKTSVEEGEEFPYTARIFVTASNTNRVYSVGITAGKEMRQLEAINVAMTPRQPLGMTPSALALNEDQTLLYVVCSDANAVAVADVSQARSRILGFIPAGWYPTAARSLADGRLVVFNGRGGGSGQRLRGSASVIDRFDDQKLRAYTQTVMSNSAYRDRLLDEIEIPAGNPVPRRAEDSSPIQHVVYIVKETRTYDQVLGGLGKGDGDASLCLYPEKVTPNHHKLAREFVLFDNFYVNGEWGADGHSWSTAAIAPDYVQKMWANSYAGRRRHYDYEGQEATALPPAGYVWTQVLSKGLSMRNYGYFATNRAEALSDGTQIENVRDPALAAVTNKKYRAFEPDYPDVERAKVFLQDLAEFERGGAMPRFLILRLGNDGASGAAPGRIWPASAMADNDHALGMIVEGCSRSRFWSKMAIFVLGSGAENGTDHVDRHRAPAYILSPYTRTGAIDSTLYNTTSMLRTMELILGLRPMTHFDAGSFPMWAAFSSAPDNRPYEAEKPRISLEDRNPPRSAPAVRSSFPR
jgi:YVTN family beta-propeller protein